MRHPLWSRLLLIPVGIGLGLVARQVFGVNGDSGEERILEPYPAEQLQEEREDEADDEAIPLDRSSDPLVDPIEIPLHRDFSNVASIQASNPVQEWLRQYEQFAHDPEASFHAHGETICASGCAASHHPTDKLTESQFTRLLRRFADEPLSQASPALEELLFYGPQSEQLLSRLGSAPLDPKRAALLRRQLQYSHVQVSIRLIDEDDHVRAWASQVRVPFDRRHVFDMQADQIQPLVTSGTLKRVGLHHIWMRL